MINQQKLLELFTQTRSLTEEICSFLETEDHVVQPVLFVSPPKWHLGHSSWFFEEFVLKKSSGYEVFHPKFHLIFNSYYESVGAKIHRHKRGDLTRPTVQQVLDYRRYITEQMCSHLDKEEDLPEKLLEVIQLGIHHEKQHQELLLTDIKFILGANPLFPKYNDSFEEDPLQNFSQEWIKMKEGIYWIGHNSEEEFCYDNELGRHKVYLQDFEISNKLVTNGEYLEFMQDEGYKDPLLWHSEAWEWILQNDVKAPLYWHQVNGSWKRFTMQGLVDIDMKALLTHISYYEAFAFAEWKKMRLPTEFEWEAAQENFDWGSRWEWTESAYLPYPSYSKAPGALGEYNGKFMLNQKVLRGGSVASAPRHIRPTYRNFFHPELRWQFSGIRLVKDKSL